MSDDPEDLLGGAVPVRAARYRLCIQCGEGFLHTEALLLCGEECNAAYEVQVGLGHEATHRQLHVEKHMVIGEPIEYEGKGYVLICVSTRGPQDTVGDFVETRFLPAESPLLQ